MNTVRTKLATIPMEFLWHIKHLDKDNLEYLGCLRSNFLCEFGKNVHLIKQSSNL